MYKGRCCVRGMGAMRVGIGVYEGRCCVPGHGGFEEGRAGCMERDTWAEGGVCAGREKGCTKAEGGHSPRAVPSAVPAELAPGPPRPTRTEQVPPAPPARARHRGRRFPPRQPAPPLAAAGRPRRAHWLEGSRGRAAPTPMPLPIGWQEAEAVPRPPRRLCLLVRSAAWSRPLPPSLWRLRWARPCWEGRRERWERGAEGKGKHGRGAR